MHCAVIVVFSKEGSEHDPATSSMSALFPRHLHGPGHHKVPKRPASAHSCEWTRPTGATQVQQMQQALRPTTPSTCEAMSISCEAASALPRKAPAAALQHSRGSSRLPSPTKGIPSSPNQNAPAGGTPLTQQVASRGSQGMATSV